MKNKIKIRGIIGLLTAICFLLSLIIPKIAYGSPWSISLIDDVDNKGKIMSLDIGDKAPFSGILFDPTAAATIQVEKETSEEKCKIKIDRNVNLEKAKLELKLANATASRDAAQQQIKAVRELKEEHIRFLTNELAKAQKKNKRDLTGVYVGAGVLGGVALTILAAIAIRQAGKL